MEKYSTKMTFELPITLHIALKKLAADQQTSVKAILIKCASQTVSGEYQRSASSAGDVLKETKD